MVKADLGTKRVCPSCGARFYDLSKRPIECPKCHFAFEPEAMYKQRRPRQPEPAQPEPQVAEPEEEEAEEETTEREEAIVEPVEGEPEISTGDDEEEEEAVEEDEDDVSGIIDTDIEKDER